MQRRTKISVAILVIVAAALSLWKLTTCRDKTSQPPATAVSDPWSSKSVVSDDSDVIAAKQRARNGAVADESPATLAGRVTRITDHQGVAGAVVMIEPDQIGGGDFQELSGVDGVFTATSTSDGSWKATVPPGRYVVSAVANDFLPASIKGISVAAKEQRTGVDIALQPGASNLSGTVSDFGGGIVVAARVTVRRDDMLSALQHDGGFSTFTDPDGHYHFALPPGEWAATVTHDDYVEDRKDVSIETKPIVLDFKLSPGASIRGTVVSRVDGKPVANALVRCESNHTSKSNRTHNISVRADGQGNFALQGVGSGAVQLEASARGFRSAAPTVVELGIGEQVTGVKVIVERAFNISGFVVKKGSKGQGVPGIIVGGFSFGSKDGVAAQMPTAPDGYFELVGVRPGTYILGAIGDGVIPSIGQTVTVTDADVTDVLLTMDSGLTISGKVQPGQRAQLSLQLPDGVSGIGDIFAALKVITARTQSDDSGAFTMTSVPDGKFELVAQTTDGKRGKIAVTIDGVNQTGLVVTLTPRASLSGTVVDTHGKPVVGVTVQASSMDRDKMMQIRMDGGNTNSVTREDGSYRIVGLDEGKWGIIVDDDGGQLKWGDAAHAAKPLLPQELVVATSAVTLALTVEARDGVIKGSVVGIGGGPEADAWVSVEIARRFSLPGKGSVSISVGGNDDDKESDDSKTSEFFDGTLVLTDAAGRFSVGNLRDGKYRVSANGAKGTTHASINDVALGSNITLKLAPLTRLHGVVRSGAAPVTEYDIECKAPNVSQERHVFSDDGSYEFPRVPEGKYTCNVSAAVGQGKGEVLVTPSADGTALDFALAAWGSVKGQLINVLNGTAISGAQIIGDAMGMEAVGALLTGQAPTTDAAGRFVFGKVRAGKGNVSFNFGGLFVMQTLASKSFTITEGQQLDLGVIKAIPPRSGASGSLGMTVDKSKVTELVADGAAAVAGVQMGDQITSILGKPVAELADLADQLLHDGNVSVGQVITLDVQRAGKPVALSITAVAAAK
jgi:uncharacterized GH25 family protein